MKRLVSETTNILHLNSKEICEDISFKFCLILALICLIVENNCIMQKKKNASKLNKHEVDLKLQA